ncbi:Mov34/MPN/PAD-1 family protein [Pseudomonas sp. Pseu.R1]|uniref:Mov34/MPN/PAD-1 family protein n=1 Tax=Pseudomonas sp. Pseu.R1 TaxID=3379818 RepID=UPI003B93F8FB
MQFMSTWADSNGQRLVYLAPEVLAIFDRYIQGEQEAEAGGILLGHVRGAHLELLEATVPTPKDRRLKYFFERLLHGHRSIAEQRWRESNGLIRYLGEWHTHPEDHPTPSGLDVTEWQKLAAARRDGRPLLAVIVGRKSLRVEYMQSNGVRHQLHSVSL